jgi:hypothetical protein
MGTENKYLYPLFKMIIGAICLILSAEYLYAFCVYQAASFGIMYIGDAVTWLSAGVFSSQRVFSVICRFFGRRGNWSPFIWG